VDDVRRAVADLGTVVGRTRAADSLLSEMDAGLEAVRAAVRGRAPVRAAYVLGGTPVWVAGPGTFLDELIGLAGGINAFSDLDTLYAPVSAEELVARDVDVYLTSRGTELDRSWLGEAAREVARALHPGVLR